MRPGSHRKLTLSTARISPRFLSWKRFDRPRASIIKDPSRRISPAATHTRVTVYYAPGTLICHTPPNLLPLCDAAGPRTSNPYAAGFLNPCTVAASPRRPDACSKANPLTIDIIPSGSSAPVVTIKYSGLLRAGASKPHIYNGTSPRARVPAGSSPGGPAGQPE